VNPLDRIIAQVKEDIFPFAIGAMILAFIFLSLTLARAQVPVPENLWQGLIAEDVSGGYTGMYAVACCVRNRLNSGMNHGLCALKRKDLASFCRKEGPRAEKVAKEIVAKVFYEGAPDVTHGATHYEAVERYGLPKWAKRMSVTVKIGEHTFFRRGLK